MILIQCILKETNKLQKIVYLAVGLALGAIHKRHLHKIAKN